MKSRDILPPPILPMKLPDIFLEFPQEALDQLSSRDSVLGAAIKRIGTVRRRICPDPFTGLVRAVLSQQISSTARDAIWQKLIARFAPIHAKDFAQLNQDALRSCGISQRKAQYLLGIAAAFANGELTVQSLAAMTDGAMIERLAALPGIGRWTAEMLLIFTFQRPNILSFSDGGIRRAICELYDCDSLTKTRYNGLVGLYSPYCTLASFYLWEVVKVKM